MIAKNIAIVAILVIAVGGGAFYGGTAYEKKQRSANLGNRMQQGRSQGMTPSGNFARGERNGGGNVDGEIISKDEKSVTIKTRDGGSKIVYFSDATSVGKSTEGGLEDLENGKQIMISGQTNSDGSVTAENIQIRPMINQAQ